jgi:PAS domain S-box-containing protein
MPGKTRAPHALLLARSGAQRDQIRAVLEDRGWNVVAARQQDALPIVQRQEFALTILDFTDLEDCQRVHELCRAARDGCGRILVITDPSKVTEAAALVAEGRGDLLLTPFPELQLIARVALAEARLKEGLSPGSWQSGANQKLTVLERSLRYHQASLEKLFQNAPEGIAIVDAEDRVIRINDEFVRMFGYSVEEALGRSINDLIAPDHLRAEADELSRGVKTARHVIEETQRRRRDGTLLDVSLLAAPIASEEEPDGAFVIYRDISERKEQERALQASEARYRALFDEAERVNIKLLERTRDIETAMAAKNRLYSALNHELRTPISAVMLYQELLLAGSMGALLPDQRDALERSHTAARHLLDVVRDVLDLSRSEASPQGLRVAHVEIGGLLQDLAHTAQPLAELHGCNLQLELPDMLPNVETDPQKLRQILLNLLSNAAKFGRAAPIELCCRVVGNELVIEVRDRGIGIAESHFQLIFEDFMQVEEGRGGGTGLGLAISRRLAELIGARLEVESQVDVGSTFRVILPIAVAVSEEQPGAAATQTSSMEMPW